MGMIPKSTFDDWHQLQTNELFDRLATRDAGLNQAEAEERLRHHGQNRITERARTSPLIRWLLQFHNSLVYVLLVTACATALLQHWVDTGVILGVVIINAIVGFIQEAKAEQAIESLRQMLAPMACLYRDGAKKSVPATQLVPGDVVVLQSGDKVPADVRLFRVKNLQIDEAPLTGESMPVEKTSEPLAGQVSLADRTNTAFAGTLVTTGGGTGVVVQTGDTTQIGRIAGMLHDVQGVDTPLIRRLSEFSRLITIAILVFCALVFLVGVLTGQGALQMLMTAVALAVSAIPEGLPAIMTIALAIGVKRMAGRNAVIRKLPAVEALGSTTVICTDKTGTLTRNEMTVTRILSIDGMMKVSGSGYSPDGTVVDEQGRAVVLDEMPATGEMARANILCNDARLRHDGQWKIEGDPTEGSLLVVSQKLGLDVDEVMRAWPRTDMIPFESERQYMATLHHNHSGQAVVYLKGSPEAVMRRCQTEWGKAPGIDPTRWLTAASHMATEGLRVLAIAVKVHNPQSCILEFEDLQCEFSLLGLVGMMDPPRSEAIEAVAKCHAAGIQVKMITGDHVATAAAVARQVGIRDQQGALTGDELDRFEELDFDRAAAEINVFARVSPQHKLRLVQSLQKQGNVVAMTGDGVNDAPALKQADIGIAMGTTGTEVAKEAAEMVLLDDNFASIERAVEEGRTVYDNLKKTIVFILPTNGGECLTLVAALMLGALLPILPLHILWINLVTTVALAITLAFDPVDPHVMQQRPRDSQAPLIDLSLLWRVLYVSVLMAVGTFGLFYYELALVKDLDVARGVAVNAIVFFEVAYLFNSRHLTHTILNRSGFCGNRTVWWGIAAVVVLQAVFTYQPMVSSLFHVAPISLAAWLRVMAASLALLLLVEAEKVVWRKLSRG